MVKTIIIISMTWRGHPEEDACAADSVVPLHGQPRGRAFTFSSLYY